MKTLTLFRACTRTLQEHWVARREIRLSKDPEDKAWYEHMAATRERQFMKLQVALTKRLQEQEEALKRLREVDGAVVKQMRQCCDEYAKGDR